MSGIGRFLEAVLCSFVVLLVLGCEQTAQPRSVPLLTPPAGKAPATTSAEDPQVQARQIVSDGLSDPNPQIRANAIEVVATTRDVRLMPKVQKLLADEVVPVRFAAALAVGDTQYSLAQNEIIGLLKDPNPNVVLAASYAVWRLGNEDYYKVLCSSIASDDQTLRANAALLLGKSGRQDGIRYLYWTLRRTDSSDKVVTQAAEAIAMLKDPAIYPKLWTRLISAYADDRVMGIRAMGALATPEAKNALTTMLDDPVPEVRLAAAEQLGRLGDRIGEAEILAVFEKNLLSGLDEQSQERIKMLAAMAIGEVATAETYKYLPPLLQDSSKVVRLSAAKAVLRASAGRLGR